MEMTMPRFAADRRRRPWLAGLVLLLAAPGLRAAEPAGADTYAVHCLACHGADLAGVDGLGVSLVASTFVGARTVGALVAFLKAGRMPDDPATVSGRAMPAFGWLPDAELEAIAAFVKSRHGG
jgi:mono/diheme cytochrome c family protein